MSATLHRMVLVTALMFGVVGTASPSLGGLAAPSACCCDAGNCHCPDARTTWIPSCCASEDTVPEQVADGTPTTHGTVDPAQRSEAGSFIAPPEATGGLSSVEQSGVSDPPGVALFTLHASFLI